MESKTLAQIIAEAKRVLERDAEYAADLYADKLSGK